MTKTIFRSTFLVGISVLILCSLLFVGLQYTQTREETYEALQQEAVYAQKGLEQGGIDYLSSLGMDNRITWIDQDGGILFDNEFPNSKANQKNYAEIRQASENGEGRSIRKSETSGVSTMYYALMCPDQTFLRLSRPLSSIQYALMTVSPVLWVLVLVLMLSGVLAFRVSRQIVQPINDLDLDHPNADTYPELAPLVSKIQEQKLTIMEEVSLREQMRREFSANVSHELKTPLTSICGFAELLSQGAVSGDRVQEFANDIYKESQRLMSLIDDIIKLSRLDEDAIEPDWEDVDLYELSQEVLDSLKPVASGMDVSLILTGTHAHVRGISQLLNEMVYNLCDNAIKYNRPSGSVTVNIASSENDIRLSVTDTGIGIPTKHQKRVFERFYRVDKSHSKEVGGTGLGLSIVKHGAQYHNATVELESEAGTGTKITLVFPVVTEAQEEV